MTTTEHTFTGKSNGQGRTSARCSCGAFLRHTTGGVQIAPLPVDPRWAAFWFARHVAKAA